MSIVDKLLRAGEGKRLKTLEGQVVEVTALEPEIGALTDDELRAKTVEFRERLADGETLDDLLPEAFAVVREAGRRVLGMRHFDVQIMGGIVLHEGEIAEMKTGEGKTLVATVPLYLNALAGKGVHLVTVNDYLAKRDAEWMGPIYESLGLTVGLIQTTMDPPSAPRGLRAPTSPTAPTTSSASTTCATTWPCSLDQCVQRGHHYAIVDEVDSILIDEARTPLIICGAPETAADTYRQFARIVPRPGRGRRLRGRREAAHAGRHRGRRRQGREGARHRQPLRGRHGELVNHLVQALQRQALFHKRRRVRRQGRRGPHRRRVHRPHHRRPALLRRACTRRSRPRRACAIREENQTLATITFQNYFRLYEKLAGMTGTAKTEDDEFRKIYGLDVVSDPDERADGARRRARLHLQDREGEVRGRRRRDQASYEKGQPVLVGTVSIEVSEMLSGMLERHGVEHNVLNAKQHEREAEIIKDAGLPGAVTIATNMAGRGVDIKLGDGVPELGGLYILGTERHESRRIDNQLRGRSGRQGDPGESRFYLSLEDDLIRLFAGDRMYKVLDRLGPKRAPIEHKMLTASIEQRAEEGRGAQLRTARTCSSTTTS